MSRDSPVLRWNIRRQVFWVTLAPLMVLVVCFEAFFIFDRYRTLDLELDTRGKLIANQLAVGSEYGVFSGDQLFLRSVSDGTLKHADVRGLVVLDASYNRLLSAGRFNADTELIGRSLAAQPGGEVLELQLQTDGEVSKVFYMPILPAQLSLGESAIAAPKPIGAVAVEFGLGRIRAQKWRVLWQSALLTLALLAVAIYLLKLASRKITQPICALNAAIDAIGKGRLETSIEVRSGVEELDNLADGLHATALELKKEREGLERRIREATEALDEKLHVLSLNEEKYRAAINTSLDGFIMADGDGHLLEVNDAYVSRSGYTRSELLTMTVPEIEAAHPPEKIRENIQRIVNEGGGTSFVSSHRTKQGEIWPTEISISSANLGEPRVFAFIRDISARVASEKALSASLQQLQEKERAKTRFLAAASHDLRQPLAAANLFVDALTYFDLTEQQTKIIHQLRTALDSLASLLNALLDVSRLDAGAVRPRIEAVAVEEIFQKIQSDFEPLATARGLRIKFFSPRFLAVKSDKSLLINVLNNLVANSLKYTAHGGVLLGVRLRGEQVWMQVYDTGIGIAQENIPHIFDEFYQVDNPQRDRTKGLGLGLSIAQRQIELLGGRIYCRSRVGKGSVFEFPLPYAGSIVHPIAHFIEESDDVRYLRGQRIVVVEDDYLVAEGLMTLLGVMGAEVRQYSSADAALADNEVLNADYYITDLMLPGKVNGLDFLRRLTEINTKPTRAVIVTGDTCAQTLEKLSGTPWTVLFKPVTSFRVVQALIEGVPI